MAGYNVCKHGFCSDCGCSDEEHAPMCDADPVGVNATCPKCATAAKPSISLGDTVSLQFASGAFDSGKVVTVHADGTVDVYRVYVHTSDFSYSGTEKGDSCVIAYIGTELVQKVNPSKLKLIEKGRKLAY